MTFDELVVAMELVMTVVDPDSEVRYENGRDGVSSLEEIKPRLVKNEKTGKTELTFIADYT